MEKLALFNVSSRKKYISTILIPDINVIEETSVVDVFIIVLKTSIINTFNLKTDKILFSFKLEEAIHELSI